MNKYHEQTYHVICFDKQPSTTSYQCGLQSPKEGFRSKPKRYRTDSNRNDCVITSSVQHGLWALKTEAISKPRYRAVIEIEKIEPRPALSRPHRPRPISKTKILGSRGSGSSGVWSSRVGNSQAQQGVPRKVWVNKLSLWSDHDYY